MDRAKLGKYAKEKGKRGEREVANILKEHGFKARRTAQYCGNTGDASDVIGIDGWHLEVKFVEKLAIMQAMKQAERDAEKHFLTHDEVLKPVVIFRKTRDDWHVCMGLEDYIELIQLWEAYRHLQDKALIDSECFDTESKYTIAYETLNAIQNKLFDSDINDSTNK